MTSVYVLDNSQLGNLFSAGEDIGIANLNALKANNDLFIIPDQIVIEASKAHYAEAFDIWRIANGITPTPTPTGIAANGQIPPDGGEKAILDIIENRAGNVIPSGSTITIGTDDLKFFKTGAGSRYFEDTVQTQDIAEQALKNGQISINDYATLASKNAGLNSKSNVTQWLTREQAIAASPIVYNTATQRNEILSDSNRATSITAAQASSKLPADGSETLFGFSKVSQAIGEIAATNPALASALEKTAKGLGGTGLVFMGYDVWSSSKQATAQAQAGDKQGAALTMQYLAARLSLGLGGAEIGAEVGALAGGTIGGPVGAAIVGIIGGVGGAIPGTSGAQGAVDAINRAVQTAMQKISQEVHGSDPNYSANFGGTDWSSILNPQNGSYQLPSGAWNDPNIDGLLGTIDGTKLATNAQGATSITLPDGHILVSTGGISSLTPKDAAPGTTGVTNSIVTFRDGSGRTHSAVVLYQSKNGAYVVEGSSISNAPITISGPTILDSSVTLLSITPPSAPAHSKVTIGDQTSNADGSQTYTLLQIEDGNVQYTQSTILSPDGVHVAINGDGAATGFDNAFVDLSWGSSATITGENNTISGGDDVDLFLSDYDDLSHITLGAGSTLWNNLDSGSSLLKYFSPTDGILNETKYYTGLDGTGWNTKNYIDLIDGTSLFQDFSAGPSGGGAGGIGTSWQLTPSGALANPHTIFQGSDALPSPNDGAALQSFKDAATTVVGLWNAIGPIDNSLFPNLSVLKFTGTQDAPPASAEFSTIAANGALLLGADYLAQYPNANTDGLFSNAAANDHGLWGELAA